MTPKGSKKGEPATKGKKKESDEEEALPSRSRSARKPATPQKEAPKPKGKPAKSQTKEKKNEDKSPPKKAVTKKMDEEASPPKSVPKASGKKEV